jgi:hypothetical protein
MHRRELLVKKENQSTGVARQYCGQIGKKENCQSGVFLNYATPKGQGLVETKLYLPQQWFEQTYAKKHDECQIPKETTSQTKNEIATQMIDKLISENQFTVRWVGCDAAFGCDHDYLVDYPIQYTTLPRLEKTSVSTLNPLWICPQSARTGRRVKHPRALEAPIRIQELTLDESIVWERRVLAQGTKGPIIADIKCVRALSCRKIKQVLVPLAPI